MRQAIQLYRRHSLHEHRCMALETSPRTTAATRPRGEASPPSSARWNGRVLPLAAYPVWRRWLEAAARTHDHAVKRVHEGFRVPPNGA
jgi:hypothetical protein